MAQSGLFAKEFLHVRMVFVHSWILGKSVALSLLFFKQLSWHRLKNLHDVCEGLQNWVFITVSGQVPSLNLECLK